MYTDKDAVENYIGKTVSVSEPQLKAWIEAMTSQVDSICDRKIQSDEEEEYLYDGNGTTTLLIKDCHNISTVEADDETIDVFEYPANKPYTNKLKAKNKVFPQGDQNVAVTAVQAMFSEVPEDVKFATTVLVAGIYNARNSKSVKGKNSVTIGNYKATYADSSQMQDYKDARTILDKYKQVAI